MPSRTAALSGISAGGKKKKKKISHRQKAPMETEPAPELYLIYISSTSRAEDKLSNCRIHE